MSDIVVLTEDEKKWMRAFVPLVLTRGGNFGTFDPRRTRKERVILQAAKARNTAIRIAALKAKKKC